MIAAKACAEEKRQRVDPLSPPVLLGGVFLVLFGWGVLDAQDWLQGDRTAFRIAEAFRLFHGVSWSALAYLLLAYLAFVVGYTLRLGRAVAKKLPLRARHLAPGATLGMSVILFGTGFSTLAYLAQRYPVSRLPGFERSVDIDPKLSYLYLVGELVLLAYFLSLWSYLLLLKDPARKPLGLEKLWLWWIMVPLLLLLLVFWSSRSRIGFVALGTLLAYHYVIRRLRWREVIFAALAIFVFVMPLDAYLRTEPSERPSIDSPGRYMAWVRDSVMARTSSLEGFTVTYENRDLVPRPDSLWLMASSAVPRIVWPTKPFADWGQRFSTWASGYPDSILTPSLPGELVVYFGYPGGILAWVALGIFWRMAYICLMGDSGRPKASGFIYILILPFSLQAMETGLVVGYGALIRYVCVGLLVLWFAVERRHVVSGRPMVPALKPGT